MAQRPTQILVTRHGEKSGDPFDPHLTPAGYARAQALAQFVPDRFGWPDFIFATARSQHSVRPIETVQPLSQRTGVPIDSSFADQDYGALATGLLSNDSFAGKRIVVCWHHGNIPSMIRVLGAAIGSYPDPWDPAIFNLVLNVEFPPIGISVESVVETF